MTTILFYPAYQYPYSSGKPSNKALNLQLRSLQAELQRAVDKLVDLNPVLSGRVWQKAGQILLEPKAHKEFLRTVEPPKDFEKFSMGDLEGLDLQGKVKFLQTLEQSLCSPMDGCFTLGHGSQVFLVELLSLGSSIHVLAVHLSHIVGDIRTLYDLVGQLNALMRGEAPVPLIWDSDLRLSFDLFPSSLSEKDRRKLQWGILGWMVQKLLACCSGTFSKVLE